MSEKLGSVLKELRIEKGLNQNELAEMLGYSNAIISFWENGKNEPTESAIIAICKFFEISADYLLGLED